VVGETAGAGLIVLPEFFTTGMAYLPAIRSGSVEVDGPVTRWLVEQALHHDIVAGGSFLCRDADGEVRNAFLLADAGGILGRHDKDLPTIWEHAFYVGGRDDGVITLRDGRSVGVALSWELMRSQTVRRLRGRVDLVLAGSAWWSIPLWRPRPVTRRWEAANRRTSLEAAPAFARLIGTPVIHASHCGRFRCGALGLPLEYEGDYEGPTGIYTVDGTTLAERPAAARSGVVAAEIDAAAVPALDDMADRFWLHRRGPLPAFAWHWHRLLGRREYGRRR
jgi:predicted amidohydrolase